MQSAQQDAVQEEGIDLQHVFSTMEKDQLEMLLIKLIMRHPEDIDDILAESQKEVDTTDLEAILQSVPEKTCFQTIAAVESFIETATDYASSYDVANAVRILGLVTPAAVQCIVNNHTKGGLPEEGSEDRSSLDSFIVALEDSWNQTFKTMSIADEKDEKDAYSCTLEELTQYFKQLAQWRQSLSPALGPIFSDPLRTLKKKIRKAPPSSSSSSSSSTSSSSSSTSSSSSSTSSSSSSTSSSDTKNSKKART